MMNPSFSYNTKPFSSFKFGFNFWFLTYLKSASATKKSLAIIYRFLSHSFCHRTKAVIILRLDRCQIIGFDSLIKCMIDTLKHFFCADHKVRLTLHRQCLKSLSRLFYFVNFFKTIIIFWIFVFRVLFFLWFLRFFGNYRALTKSMALALAKMASFVLQLRV